MTTTRLYSQDAGVRPEIEAAHQRLLDHLQTPGEWWSSTERLAIAQEVRRARTADPLPPWIAPSTVDGLVPAGHQIASPVVDAVWRIANHPGSITRDWFDTIIGAGIEPAAYVEVVAIVAMTVALDEFCRSAGCPALPLPEPSSSSARGAVGEGVVEDHWVPTLATDLPNVRKALSIVPAELEMQGVILDAQYVPGGALAVELTQDIWSLGRLQVELVASRVSSVNECFY